MLFCEGRNNSEMSKMFYTENMAVHNLVCSWVYKTVANHTIFIHNINTETNSNKNDFNQALLPVQHWILTVVFIIVTCTQLHVRNSLKCEHTPWRRMTIFSSYMFFRHLCFGGWGRWQRGCAMAMHY